MSGDVWTQPRSHEPGGWKNQTFETECPECGTRLLITNNYSPMGDFEDQSVSPICEEKE